MHSAWKGILECSKRAWAFDAGLEATFFGRGWADPARVGHFGSLVHGIYVRDWHEGDHHFRRRLVAAAEGPRDHGLSVPIQLLLRARGAHDGPRPRGRPYLLHWPRGRRNIHRSFLVHLDPRGRSPTGSCRRPFAWDCGWRPCSSRVCLRIAPQRSLCQGEWWRARVPAESHRMERDSPDQPHDRRCVYAGCRGEGEGPDCSCHCAAH
mmetsp:Transcript_17531/g.41280  ORF Transcript_17531/g.41280 Transcript_17531/m.41280 type:complete len:208 (-) Transcript_17531:446-1069(-)